MFKASTLFFVLFPSVVVEKDNVRKKPRGTFLTLMALVRGVKAKCKTSKMKLVYNGFIAL